MRDRYPPPSRPPPPCFRGEERQRPLRLPCSPSPLQGEGRGGGNRRRRCAHRPRGRISCRRARRGRVCFRRTIRRCRRSGVRRPPGRRQRLFERVRFVKGERRIVPVSGLLDETVDARRSAIPQAHRAGEPEPGGVVDPLVEVAERQQPRLLLDESGEEPAPDAARVVFGQPRIDEQPSVFRQPVPRSPEEIRKVEMMHRVEGGHEVVTAGLEFEVLGGRPPRLEPVDPAGLEQPVGLLQHRGVGVDARQKEVRDHVEHQEGIPSGAAADVGAPRQGQAVELPRDPFHRFPVGRADGPVDRRHLGEMPDHVGPRRRHGAPPPFRAG